MEAADNSKVTIGETVRERVPMAPEERGRRAHPGEQLAGVPELTRALAVHYKSLAGLVTLRSTQSSLELRVVTSELRDMNQRLGVLIDSLDLIVRRTLQSRARAERWWRDPQTMAAAVTWLLAGCILGAVLARL